MSKIIKAINYANKETFQLSTIQILSIVTIVTLVVVNIYLYGIPKY